jgi:hypothetical protein
MSLTGIEQPHRTIMTTRPLAILSIAGLLAVALTAAQAQTTPQPRKPSSSPPLSPTEQAISDIKNPVPWLSWGADLRLRNEYFNNAQTLTSDPAKNPIADLHAQDYFRFRGRVWTSIMPADGLSLNGRFAAEPRLFMEPSSSGTYLGQSGTEWRYGIVDNLNVQWKKPADLPLSLIVGRQDIFLGDGFLVADGTPADGSWTYFLDAARLTLDLKEAKTTVDVIGIVHYARADAWLPIVDNQPNRFLTDQNEKGVIAYVANKSLPAANVDAYVMYKHDTRVNNPPAAGLGDNADIYTLGARLSGLVGQNVKYSVEGAYQFGEKQDPRLRWADDGLANEERDISAFGGTAKLTYLFKDKLNNQLSLAAEYLSGDDPSSGEDEMFDLLWGRWPRWSELYNIYSYVPEHRVGQTANVIRFGPAWAITPMKNMDFTASYNALFAPQDTPTRAGNPGLFTNDGNFRGHYLQSVLKYKFSRHVNGHLWGEFIFPGDYYAARHPMTFLRAELMFIF